MRVPDRAPPTGSSRVVIRSVGAVLVLALAVACGSTGAADSPLVEPEPGRPAGTGVRTAGTDPAQTVQLVRDAVTAGGGTVATVVDHAANARAVGVEIPPNSVVIGGAAPAQVALVRVDQRAAASLPLHYLVRQDPAVGVTLTWNSADYVTAVSGVTAPDARAAVRDATAAVIEGTAPAGGDATGTHLVGVTPVNRLLGFFGGFDVPATVDRIRRNARGPSRAVAIVDLAAGSANPGPAVRPTSVVFVSSPQFEAPLLAAAPSMGLELPLPFIVWLDDQNLTQVAYPDVVRLAERHGLPPGDPNVSAIAVAADRLARLAAGVVQQ